MTRRDPDKSRFKSLLLYPFEAAFAVLFTVIGLGLVLSGFSLSVSKVQELPPALVGAWAVALLLGGPAILSGLFWREANGTARAVERAGLYLSISVWLTYAVTILVFAPLSIVPILQGVTISVACASRAHVLSKVDRVVAHIASVVDADLET